MCYFNAEALLIYTCAESAFGTNTSQEMSGDYPAHVISAYHRDPRRTKFSLESWVKWGFARRVAPELYNADGSVKARAPKSEGNTPVALKSEARAVEGSYRHHYDEHSSGYGRCTGQQEWFGAFCHHAALVMVESDDLQCNLRDHRWMTHVFAQCFTSDHLYPERYGGYRAFWATHGVHNCTRYFSRWSGYMCGYMDKCNYSSGYSVHALEGYLSRCDLRARINKCVAKCRRRRKGKTHRRRRSCSSSSSSSSGSEQEEEGDGVEKIELPMPALAPITAAATAKEMPALVPITAATKEMPALVPITAAATKEMPALVPITAAAATKEMPALTTDSDMPALEPLSIGSAPTENVLALRRLRRMGQQGSLAPRRPYAAEDLVPLRRDPVPAPVHRKAPTEELVPLPPVQEAQSLSVPTTIQGVLPRSEPVSSIQGAAAAASNFLTLVAAYRERCPDNALSERCAIFAPTNAAVTAGALKAISEGSTEELRNFVQRYVCVSAPVMLTDGVCQYEMAAGTLVCVKTDRTIRDYPMPVQDTVIHQGHMIMMHGNLFTGQGE